MTAEGVLILVLFGAILILMVVVMTLEARASSLARRKGMFKRLWEEVEAERQEMLMDREIRRRKMTELLDSQRKEIWAFRTQRTELLREVGDLKKENGMLIRAINEKVMETKTPPPPSPNLDKHV